MSAGTKPPSGVGSTSYPITVEPGVLGRVGELVRTAAPAHRYVLITDSNVGPLYAERVSATIEPSHVDILTFPSGEIHKTRATWADLTDQLAAAGCGRDTTIIALGGGVVCDIAGFVAATYMRGVGVVQVPTTLLAMIDASIGGKTGVDTPFGKNMVGSFHPPRAVVIDPETLATLGLAQLRTGFAEAIKHGVIADRAYFDSVEGSIPQILSAAGVGSDALLALIVRSIEIKSEIVERDERETGVRKILNFGHTVGHAIETLSEYSIPHGEAVGIGMAVECRIAELAGIAEVGTAESVGRSLAIAGLPSRLPAGIRVDQVMQVMKRDKKVRSGRIEYSLPVRIGEMAGSDTGWAVAVDDNLVMEAFA